MNTAVIVVDGVTPALLTGLAWLMPSLIGRTLPFGVRTPAERADAPVIAEQRGRYRWRVALGGAVVIAAGLVLSAVLPASAVPPVVLPALVPLLTVVVWLVAYHRARVAIMAVKRREDWYRGLRQGVVADTSLRTDPERFPWPWSLPALLVCAGTAVAGVLRYPSLPDRLPLHFGSSGVDRWGAKSVGTAFFPVFAQIATTAVILVVTWLAFRSRADLDPARPADSARRHRRFTVRTAVSLLVLAACVNLTMFVGAWAMWHPDQQVSLVLAMLPILAGTVVTLVVAFRTGQGGSRLPEPEGAEPEEDTGVVRRDDDRYWHGFGSLYVNRADPAIFVPKRFGIGWTVNFGNPRGLLVFGLLRSPVVVLPLLLR
ncbi:hypothetical protein B1H19_14380 [Streptomyces gilvosporeus]|uniref:DUF1648 domain-containing protein n=1 Tax=Streptomyces gilvosporeus TaxID=553510 RepID=A0A1V0TRD0_9ACTN|nr:DUF5808 domain-containing protein [Streptomyces gilvosporeus]ARF55222.1 hypothetical protein B1H19_14380 [Streptomyces gilvosporeus]